MVGRSERNIDNAIRCGADGVKMIGETVGVSRGKHVIAESKRLRIGPVVGDVGLLHLSVGNEFVVLVRANVEVESVHLSAINTGEGAKPSVAKVLRCSICGVSEGYDLAVGNHACAGAIGSGEQSKVVIKAAILPDQKDNVLNLVHVALGQSPIAHGKKDENGGYEQPVS